MECCGVFLFVQIKVESRRVNYDQEERKGALKIIRKGKKKMRARKENKLKANSMVHPIYLSVPIHSFFKLITKLVIFLKINIFFITYNYNN